MPTKLPKRIPIPRDLVAGDVVVDNEGRHHDFIWYDKEGDASCGGPLFRQNGFRYCLNNGYAVKIIRAKKRKPAPVKVKEDADAKWLRGLRAPKSTMARLNKIAKRLEAK